MSYQRRNPSYFTPEARWPIHDPLSRAEPEHRPPEAMPILPPREPAEEPWYDARYRAPDEDPADRVGARYRGAPDPRYLPADYAAPLIGPRPMMFDGRDPGLPRPGRSPIQIPRMPDREGPLLPTDLVGPRPAAPVPDPVVATPLHAPLAVPSEPPEPDWPAPALDPVLTPPVEPPMPESMCAPEPSALERLIDAAYPGLGPEPDPFPAAEQAFDQQLRDAFSTPIEPVGWNEALPGYGGLEQLLLDPSSGLHAPFPDAGTFML